MSYPAGWRSSTVVKPKNGESAHFYKYRSGLEVYVWVKGLDGRNVCGVVKITRRQVEEYLAQYKALTK